MMDRHKEALAEQEYAVRMRRDFHQNPELSGEEVRTSARICEELDTMGIPYDRVAPLNVVARLEGKPTGHTLAIRADFDALPIQEAVESPYRSRTDGKMHACGHDAHTAILLAVARALAPHREELGGTVYFCFQMGEERGLGAQEIVDYLQERGGVEHAIGLHVEPAFRAGEMGLYDRKACAGAFSWELVIHGKGDMVLLPIAPWTPSSPSVRSCPGSRLCR